MENPQQIRLGGQELPLNPENEELAELISESESQQAKAIEQQYRLGIERTDFIPLTLELSGLKKGIDEYFDTKAKAPQAPHAHQWESIKNREILERLKALRDQIVVDLGSGRTSPVFQKFLKRYNPRAYIGVDSRNVLGVGRQRSKVEGFGDVGILNPEAGDELEGLMVRGDMLRAASRLPNNSVSVALNGIDDYIVKVGSPYEQRMEEEILRVLHPDGIVFGLQLQPGLLGELAKNEGLEMAKLPLPEKPYGPEAGFYVLHRK